MNGLRENQRFTKEIGTTVMLSKRVKSHVPVVPRLQLGGMWSIAGSRLCPDFSSKNSMQVRTARVW